MTDKPKLLEKIEYKEESVVFDNPDSINLLLEDEENNGWELIGNSPFGGGGGWDAMYLLIFKRPKV